MQGRKEYKKHTESSYFFNVCIDSDSLAREFPQSLSRMRELQMGFAFAELD